MNVGFVGLGKLGLPVAVAMASRGLDVYGHDVLVPDVLTAQRAEQGFAEAHELAGERFRICELDEVVGRCDVVFIAVQTPHEPQYEGVTRLPSDRADFDYRHLRNAVRQVTQEAHRQRRELTVAVISTVLPGTLEREVKPLLGGCSLVYNPSFIAMGTTIADFLDPEFVLLGAGRAIPRRRVTEIYDRVLGTYQLVNTSIADAELVKVAYNTFIGLKIAFANTLLEVCQKTGCDVDVVTGALKRANRRLISGAYLEGGMGDGGACHPRDNIALSWLAGELGLSHDLFDDVMLAREDQAEWLAMMLIAVAARAELPIGILGLAYKPGSAITTGSAAKLVRSLLAERNHESYVHDPHVLEPDVSAGPVQRPRVYLVGCRHPEYPIRLPEGSVVIDPFRFWPDQRRVEVVRLGEAAR